MELQETRGLPRAICQIGFMTDDFYRTLDAMLRDYQTPPWDVYTHTEDTLQNILFREQICEPHFKFYCGVTMLGDLQLEVIQPVYGMPFYTGFLERHGPGLHHLKEKVAPDTFEETIERYRRQGMEPLFGANLFESRFCFLNSQEKLGFQLEIGNGMSPVSAPKTWKAVYTGK